MLSKSLEGLTLAFIFDWVIILLTALGPFLLPLLAKVGEITRLFTGFTSISLGLFLGVLFYGPYPPDPDKHWVLVNNLELISMMFFPFSLILFILLPPLYVWLGFRILKIL
jgi:hypothetical protein